MTSAHPQIPAPLHLEFGGKTVELRFPEPMPEGRSAGILYLIGDHGIPAALPPVAAVAVIGGIDWNRELSPWRAERVFSRGDAFGGEAETFLRLLTDTVIPGTEARLGQCPAFRGIAGYSLAGLFAVWSLYRTAVFDRAASVSGSLWFDGFAEYACTHPLAAEPECLYFSYGSREPDTANPRMKRVGVCTEELAAYYGKCGIPTWLEVNPGGHFDRPEERIARGLRALTGQPGSVPLRQTDSGDGTRGNGTERTGCTGCTERTGGSR